MLTGVGPKDSIRSFVEKNKDAKIFESRKKDHIRYSLSDKNEAKGEAGMSSIELVHQALPEINFSEVDIRTTILEKEYQSPFFVSSMTAGHRDGIIINQAIAEVCADKNWLMGVGSQRKELFEPEAAKEWQLIRETSPKVKFMGNLGLSQLIHTEVDAVRKLVDSLQAVGMIIHTNPLQECLQKEGTPNFKGGIQALDNLSRNLGVPVILKETGCGFSAVTLKRLNEIPLTAVDVSGYGGTHWGRIEGDRALSGSLKSVAADTFADWGISTVDSLLNAREIEPHYKIWASGGVRSGLDAAKLIALGAQAIGIAKPILEAVIESQEHLAQLMERFEFELKAALFCTGNVNISEFQQQKAWKWKKS